MGYQHSYPKMESWKKGTDYCSWDGVTCDRVKGNLIGLDRVMGLVVAGFKAPSL